MAGHEPGHDRVVGPGREAAHGGIAAHGKLRPLEVGREGRLEQPLHVCARIAEQFGHRLGRDGERLSEPLANTWHLGLWRAEVGQELFESCQPLGSRGLLLHDGRLHLGGDRIRPPDLLVALRRSAGLFGPVPERIGTAAQFARPEPPSFGAEQSVHCFLKILFLAGSVHGPDERCLGRRVLLQRCRKLGCGIRIERFPAERENRSPLLIHELRVGKRELPSLLHRDHLRVACVVAGVPRLQESRLLDGRELG